MKLEENGNMKLEGEWRVLDINNLVDELWKQRNNFEAKLASVNSEVEILTESLQNIKKTLNDYLEETKKESYESVLEDLLAELDELFYDVPNADKISQAFELIYYIDKENFEGIKKWINNLFPEDSKRLNAYVSKLEQYC